MITTRRCRSASAIASGGINTITSPQRADDGAAPLSNPNEDLVVAIAVDVLAAKRWLEDAPDEELLADLRRLYHTNPVCQLEVRYTGELLHDMLASRPGEYLAAAYDRRRVGSWLLLVAMCRPGRRTERHYPNFVRFMRAGSRVGWRVRPLHTASRPHRGPWALLKTRAFSPLRREPPTIER